MNKTTIKKILALLFLAFILLFAVRFVLGFFLPFEPVQWGHIQYARSAAYYDFSLEPVSYKRSSMSNIQELEQANQIGRASCRERV